MSIHKVIRILNFYLQISELILLLVGILYIQTCVAKGPGVKVTPNPKAGQPGGKASRKTLRHPWPTLPPWPTWPPGTEIPKIRPFVMGRCNNCDKKLNRL